MAEDLKKAYHTILTDHFPSVMEITFREGDQRTTMQYEKVTWEIDGVRKGLRYGENPGQEAALYKLVNGNLAVGDVTTIEPGQYLVSDATLLQFGKHPGKINLTDADNALNILRYMMDTPACAIMKHNNPSGVAIADTITEAYLKADMADRLAAYGGAIALNRPVTKDLAKEIVLRYAEVLVAPEYEEGVLEILAQRPNLRIMKINAIERLAQMATRRFIDFKSLIDGGIIAQTSYVPSPLTREELKLATTEFEDKQYRINREPTDQEYKDMLFGWKVEAGVTSNSVLFVKDGVTVGIGTGEQDRVGVAQIAVSKAYTKLADRLAFERHNMPYNMMTDAAQKAAIDEEVQALKGGLIGSAMISDAFFPFRDGVDVGLVQGVTSVLQAGGSVNDYQSIDACNEAGATMVFTGQRSFKH